MQNTISPKTGLRDSFNHYVTMLLLLGLGDASQGQGSPYRAPTLAL